MANVARTAGLLNAVPGGAFGGDGVAVDPSSHMPPATAATIRRPGHEPPEALLERLARFPFACTVDPRAASRGPSLSPGGSRAGARDRPRPAVGLRPGAWRGRRERHQRTTVSWSPDPEARPGPEPAKPPGPPPVEADQEPETVVVAPGSRRRRRTLVLVAAVVLSVVLVIGIIGVAARRGNDAPAASTTTTSAGSTGAPRGRKIARGRARTIRREGWWKCPASGHPRLERSTWREGRRASAAARHRPRDA